MRLLQLKSNGEFGLTKDLITDIPPYAILSHTWGNDEEEVTFKDLAEGSRDIKARYQKIQFCAEQAGRDSLQYFWVDTCCIDKSNNTELSEAINSMFRWYRNAAKCYVYLSDVSTNEYNQNNLAPQSWEAAFRKSRWFTRGWTLQELIAPPSVEFFSVEGKRLGDKKSLGQQIHEATGLAVQALEGSTLFEYSVDERMSWAEKRETKREEDKAYSLLGIFNIHMPLIYGEGMKNAFRRLQEEIDKCSSIDRSRLLSSGNSTYGDSSLDSLHVAVDAPFNSYQRQHEPTCLDNTRVDILHEIHTWADGQDEPYIFWLSGLAGTGKSTIARTVARRYFEKNRLGASFFFTKGGGDVGHAGKFVTSVAIQLANSVPTLRRYICDTVRERSDIIHQSLREQWSQLVLRPLSKVDNGCHSSYVLVIDALDECNNNNNIRMILQLLVEARSMQRVKLRVFLTSRPEIPIRYGFKQIPNSEHQDFILHSISPSIIDHDISIFLEHTLRLIGQEHSLDASKEVVGYLVQIASGLFIWAATACRFIREGKRFAVKRLDTILQGSGRAVIAPEKHLDEIYTTVLEHSIALEYTDEEKEESYCMLRHILGSIVILFSPLSVYSLSRLLKEDIKQTLEDLHSILDIPKDQNCPLRLHHPSFRDFLLNNNRCKNPNFRVDEKQAHQTLADSCIQLMSTSLKQDICGLKTPGVLVSDVESSRVKCSLSSEVQYACLYWIQHLYKSGAQLRDDGQVHHFLQEHLLHWLEALGWMQKVSEGVYAITSLESITMTCNCPQLAEFVHDAKRFVLYNRPAIEQAPLQTYCSALIFAPLMSKVREQFKDYIPRWVQRLPRVENNWNPLLETLEGHSDFVNAIVFSPDGKLLASASSDQTVRLWDPTTGAALQTFKGHSSSVYAIVFSPDGKQLVSASSDRTIRLWDPTTGAALQTLKGHWRNNCAITFLPDGKLRASDSNNYTVRLWDPTTGAVLQTLKGHSGSVKAIVFSPDGKLLASVSYVEIIRLWDLTTGAALQTFKGHSSSVYAIVFSPDSKLLALVSNNKTIRLWNPTTGALLRTLEGHLDIVKAIAFSPDNKKLASVSRDKTIRLWDAATGAMLQIFKGYYWEWVRAIAFSPDGKLLALAPLDNTVRLLDTAIGPTLQTLEGHSQEISAIAFSPDGKQVVSTSWYDMIRLWDPANGAVLKTMDGHGYVTAIAFSPDSKRLASASDRTVRLWDVATGAALQKLEGQSHWIVAVAFSPDGKQLASASEDGIVRLWDATTGAALQTLEGHSGKIFLAIGFSPDSKKLAFASETTIRLWDLTRGIALRTLEGNWHFTAVAVSPDGKLLASASIDGAVELWDAGSGAILQTLEVGAVVRTLSFSNDGTFLQTNRGPLYHTFHSDSAAVSRPNLPPSVFIKDQWVSRGMENILWLPFEYRPSRVTVHGNIIAFGYKSGRVAFMEFAF